MSKAIKKTIRSTLSNESNSEEKRATSPLETEAVLIFQTQSGISAGGIQTALPSETNETIGQTLSANLNIVPDDFNYATFNPKGGLGKVHGLFGSDLTRIWGS